MTPKTLNQQLNELQQELDDTETQLSILLESDDEDDDYEDSDDFRIQIDYLSEKIDKITKEMQFILSQL